jgi:hypothetical protein
MPELKLIVRLLMVVLNEVIELKKKEAQGSIVLKGKKITLKLVSEDSIKLLPDEKP